MKVKKYMIRTVRISDCSWKLLKEERIKSGKTWNVFLLKLLGKEKVYAKHKN